MADDKLATTNYAPSKVQLYHWKVTAWLWGRIASPSPEAKGGHMTTSGQRNVNRNTMCHVLRPKTWKPRCAFCTVSWSHGWVRSLRLWVAGEQGIQSHSLIGCPTSPHGGHLPTRDNHIRSVGQAGNTLLCFQSTDFETIIFILKIGPATRMQF